MKGIGLGHALRGLLAAVRRERNVRIELMAACYALAAVWLGKAEPWAKLAVLLCCMAVIGLELINSALENLCDRTDGGQNTLIKHAKDMAAGAVFWAALGSLAVAAVIAYHTDVWDRLFRPAPLLGFGATLPVAALFIAGRKTWRKREMAVDN